MRTHETTLTFMWSLGIEEQFYLVWPLLLWIIPRRWLGYAVALILISSFALNISMIKAHPSEVFYLPFTRAWELMAGALIARYRPLRGMRAEWAAVAGLGTILASLLLFGPQTVFPGWAALFPVVGTMLLIVSRRKCAQSYSHR